MSGAERDHGAGPGRGATKIGRDGDKIDIVNAETIASLTTAAGTRWSWPWPPSTRQAGILVNCAGLEHVARSANSRLTAIKRLIEPEEVAELVAFRCRPGAAFAGSSWVLDGGWTAR